MVWFRIRKLIGDQYLYSNGGPCAPKFIESHKGMIWKDEKQLSQHINSVTNYTISKKDFSKHPYNDAHIVELSLIDNETNTSLVVDEELRRNMIIKILNRET